MNGVCVCVLGAYLILTSDSRVKMRTGRIIAAGKGYYRN